MDPSPNLDPGPECITVTIPVPARQKVAVPTSFVFFSKSIKYFLIFSIIFYGAKSVSRTLPDAGEN
jgi:hypothetical protein